MAEISLIPTFNEARGQSVSCWLHLQGSSLSNLISVLSNTGITVSFSNSAKDIYAIYFKYVFNDEDCSLIGGQGYDCKSALQFNLSVSDEAYYDSDLEGKELEIKLYADVNTHGSGYRMCCIYWFKGILPSRNGQSSFYLQSSVCWGDELAHLHQLLGDISSINRDAFRQGSLSIIPASQAVYPASCTFNLKTAEPEPTPCQDVRNSANQQSLHLVVSDGQNNVTTTDITFNLSDGANQELALRTYMNDTVYNYFNNIYNQNQGVMARIMFNGGVCRSACTVRIVARVYGQAVSVEPSLTYPYVTLDYDILAGHDVDILRATFEECNDKPVRIQEDLVAYLDGLKSQNTFSVGFSIYQVVPYKIVITGCEALSEWCCDDVAPIEDDSIEYDEFEEPLIQGYGGGSSGGGEVDITCICDGLTSLNQMLATKLDNLVDGQAVIADAISDIQVDLNSQDIVDSIDSVASAIEDKDFSCICDNLGTINDTIDSKELSVTNNVAPCQPIVTNPVNNITVEPCQPSVTVTNPVNNITVEPCQPIVTNPVNNITVEPSDVDIDLSNLETILEDSLNHDNKSISAILDNSLNMVNPCDDTESLSITQALFKVTDDGENCIIKSISDILDEKFLEPQIDIVLDNQLVGHIYKQNYDYRNY